MRRPAERGGRPTTASVARVTLELVALVEKAVRAGAADGADAGRDERL